MIAVTLFAFFPAVAQLPANGPVKTVTSGDNLLATLLVVMTIILAFVIWGMGQVLVALGKQVIEKKRSSSALTVLVLLAAAMLFTHQAVAQQAIANEVVKVVPNYGGLSETTFYLFVTVVSVEVIAILFLAFAIRRMYTELMPEKVKQVSGISQLRAWWSGLDKKLFTKAVPVEKEADVLLDHNYDGIQELDNALPPWWKYGFYFTIGVACIYLLNFHVFGYGKSPSEEYTAEMEKARIEKEIFESKNKDRIDENNVPMADAAGLAQGKTFFLTDCFPCHGKLGEGLVGPNLTDEYWLHKGSLNDIYQTIKHGYPDKGMQSWAVKYNPKEISLLASYVKSLRGSNPPNGKAPQGDLYIETVSVSAADSTKPVKVDSAKSVKTVPAPVKK